MCRPLQFHEIFAPGCFGGDDFWLRPAVLSVLPALERQPGAFFSQLGAACCQCEAQPHHDWCPARFSPPAHGRLSERASRLCQPDELTPGQLLAPALRATAARISASPSSSKWLCVHDMTEFNLTSFRSMTGLGELDEPSQRGIKLLSSLAVDDRGVCVGPLQAQCWTRPVQDHPVARTKEEARALANEKVKRNRARAFEEKETYRWWEAISEVEVTVGECGRVLHVIDSAGAIHELFEHAAAAGAKLLVRVGQDRRVDGPSGRLWVTLEQQPVVGRRLVWVPERPRRKGKPARSARWTWLELRFGSVMLHEPHAGKGRLPMDGVLVKEVDPPEGEEPIEWLLLTNERVTTASEAWWRVDWYRWRWRVEDYHKILKTNCRMEKRRFAHVEQFERALELYIMVGTKLLELRDLARVEPQLPATQVLEPLELEVLQVSARVEKLGPLSEEPTLEEAVKVLGRLGGHQGRPCDGPVGWQTLSKGYAILQERLAGYRLALEEVQLARPSRRRK